MHLLSRPLVLAPAGVLSRARSVALISMLVAGGVGATASDTPLILAEAVRLAQRDAPMIAARRAKAEAALGLIGPSGERPVPNSSPASTTCRSATAMLSISTAT